MQQYHLAYDRRLFYSPRHHPLIMSASAARHSTQHRDHVISKKNVCRVMVHTYEMIDAIQVRAVSLMHFVSLLNVFVFALALLPPPFLHYVVALHYSLMEMETAAMLHHKVN
jgi:hypothetical protein